MRKHRSAEPQPLSHYPIIPLSSGSNFFYGIFLKSNHTNMLIYLKEISSAELEHVPDFLYNGETSCTQEELNKFLETA
jgi:hypothetical protein